MTAAPTGESDGLYRAARILGAAVMAAIGQLVVDTPGGYLGATDQMTRLGAGFAAAMLVLGVLAALGFLGRTSWAKFAAVLVAAAAIAFFLPALAADPVVAGMMIAWQLAVIGSELVGERDVGERPPIAFRQRANEPLRRATSHLLLVGVLITVLVAGFELTNLMVGQVACLVFDVIVIALCLPSLWSMRSMRGLTFLVAIWGLAVAATATDLLPLLAVLGVYGAGMLLLSLARGPLTAELLEHFLARPAVLILASFASLIVGGTVFLTFPAATEAGELAVLDALFTATSAVCVTGLIVVDTPTAFTTFGEAIILLLIQVGGIGIMVVSTFATVILGGRLGLRGEHALEQMLEMASPVHAYRLVRFIVLSTFAIEAVGALVLTLSFVDIGLSAPEALWRGVFHAVSAFCNAGFSLQSDSIMLFVGQPVGLIAHAVLIVFGGLGFAVLAWIWDTSVRRVRGRAPVQVRVALLFSAAFLILGALVYGTLEWDQSLAGLPPRDKALNAFFQSVTTRTAGFNSVDITAMRPATTFLVMVLMFLGACPGGTGGGIKLTTFAVLTAAIPAMISGRNQVTLFGRQIPAETLLRAATIAVVASGFAAIAFFILLLTEHHDFVTTLFEVLSALGTVGLSLGMTPQLTGIGELVIIFTMFVGRVGPLTLALVLARPGRRPIEYPTTRIMIG